MNEKSVSHPLLMLCIKRAQNLISDWSKKITKMNGEQYSKILGKICHNNPFVVMKMLI